MSTLRAVTILSPSEHMRGKRSTAFGAGLTLIVVSGSACSLLTKLDAPTGDAPGPGVGDATADGAGAVPLDAGSDAPLVRLDACADSPTCGVDAYYAAGYVAQSFPLATTPLTMVEGEVLPSFIELANTGETAWDSTVELATTMPRNRVSAFADSTWVAPDRPAQVKGTIPPGVTYKFQFDLRAPSKPGTYFEYFGLVGGKIWFGDPGQGGPPDNDLEVQIDVVADAGHD